MNRWHVLIPAGLVLLLAPLTQSSGETRLERLAQGPSATDRSSPRRRVTPAPTPTPATTPPQGLTDMEIEALLVQNQTGNLNSRVFQGIRPAPTQPPFRGKVIEVADGDTIVVEAGAKETTVRLYGIDCPEFNQPFGDAARQFTSNMVLDHEVEVVSQRNDKFGRAVAIVNIGDASLNDALVINGLAWQSNPPEANESHVKRLLRIVRLARRGLWRERAPVAPWEWRQTQAAALKAQTSPAPTATPAPTAAPTRRDSQWRDRYRRRRER